MVSERRPGDRGGETPGTRSETPAADREASGLLSWLARQLAVTLLQALGLAALAGAFLLAFGQDVPILDAWAVAVVLVLAFRLNRLLQPARRPRSRSSFAVVPSIVGIDVARLDPAGGGRPDQHVDPLPATLERRFKRMYRHTDRVTYAVVEARHYDTGVRPVLADLAADRLRRHHGVLVDDRPDAARRLLGRELWQAIFHPRDSPPTTDDLERWVAALEHLDEERYATTTEPASTADHPAPRGRTR